MKHIKEFDNWATKIVNDLLIERQDNSQGKRAIERSRDIAYQAMQKYPEYSQEQAISLYVADKLEDSERRDFDQNKLINLQRRENEKLKNNLSDIKSEIQSIENDGQKTDSEIARLKQLSGQIQTDVKQRRLSAKDIDTVLSQVEQLKNKPGISKEQYDDIKKQVEIFRKEKVNPAEFSNFKNQLMTLATKDVVNRQQVDDLENKLNDLQSMSTMDLSKADKMLADLQSTKNELIDRQNELDKKENEFKKRVDDEISRYRKAVKSRSKQASTKINALIGGRDVPISTIKNLGNILNKLSTETDPDNTDVSSIINLKRGLQKVGNIVSDQNSKINNILGIKSKPDISDLISLSDNPTHTTYKQSRINNSTDNEEETMNIKEHTQKSESDLPTEEQLDKLTDYYNKLWRQIPKISEIFNKYDPNTVEITIRENFREIFEDYDVLFFKSNINGVILRMIIDDLDFFTKKLHHYNFRAKNRMKNQKSLKEFNAALNALIGKEVLKWLK